MQLQNNKTILISGATGTIGIALCKYLVGKGYVVHGLSRTAKKADDINYFVWDPSKKYIDKAALKNVSYIIHLAGEGIMDKRWTDKRKNDLIESRVDSAQFLLEVCKQEEVKVKMFISASGVGYYGTSNTSICTEENAAGTDFLAECCVAWENSAASFQSQCSVAIMRLGIVLDSQSGALPKLASPVKFGIGSALGSGEQAMPWVHIYDVCSAFEFVLKNHVSGTFNVVSDEMHSNKSFLKIIASVLRRPFIFPKVPAFVLRLLLGESSIAILEGQKVSNQKLKQTGFTFRFPYLKDALFDLLKR